MTGERLFRRHLAVDTCPWHSTGPPLVRHHNQTINHQRETFLKTMADNAEAASKMREPRENNGEGLNRAGHLHGSRRCDDAMHTSLHVLCSRPNPPTVGNLKILDNRKLYRRRTFAILIERTGTGTLKGLDRKKPPE